MKTVHTPHCQGKEKHYYGVNDRNRGRDEPVFSYLKCDECQVLRLERVPENLADFYPQEYYNVPSLRKIQNMGERDTFKIDLVQKYIRSGRLLEIGPAFGVFALQAKAIGFDVSTIELDHQCCEFLNQTANIPTYQSSEPQVALSNLPQQNAIALWHVIEHLPDPWAVIEGCATKLIEGGFLFIAAPNSDSFQHQSMQQYWPHTDAPRHLYQLPASALICVAQRNGLELVHQTTKDRYAMQMNRFGWQRVLMNLVPGIFLKAIMYVLGYALSIIMSPWDNREGKGSAFTLVFRKKPV